MTNQEVIQLVFKEWKKHDPERIVRLSGGGSNREYYRVFDHDGSSCIGVFGHDTIENRCFIRLACYFRSAGIHVPQIYIVYDSGEAYLQQDLGDCQLLDLLKYEDRYEQLVIEALSQLVKMQTLNPSRWASKVRESEFGLRQIYRDLNYFKYEYLKPSGVLFNEDRLDDDFDRLTNDLMKTAFYSWGFMYRDFQSRNIMIDNGQLYFIDFQGGRPGPGLYDAVSFLWQAAAGFKEPFRWKMLAFYCQKLALHRNLDENGVKNLLSSAPLFCVFRTLQTLGAYGLRGLIERKAHFITSIPGALANIKTLLKIGALNSYPELKKICKRMCEDSRFVNQKHPDSLLIKVFSFSYKKGYPDDFTGNGGGFMFDCRGMHNPGRYPEFHNLTGRDREVIDFLRERREADKFAEDCFRLVAPSVSCYLKRGFKDLQIGFGCTGGQHRSVYCAEYMAQRLASEFPDACVRLIHREQRIDEVLAGKSTEQQA